MDTPRRAEPPKALSHLQGKSHEPEEVSVILKLLTLALTALSAIPGGAHLFELPAKIGMTEADYFTAQSIYAG